MSGSDFVKKSSDLHPAPWHKRSYAGAKTSWSEQLWIDWHGSVLLGCLECDDMRCTSWTARIAVLFWIHCRSWSAALAILWKSLNQKPQVFRTPFERVGFHLLPPEPPRLSSAFMEMTLSLAQQRPLVFFQHKFFFSERYVFVWFVEHDHPLFWLVKIVKTIISWFGSHGLTISRNSCGDDGHLPRHRHAVVLEIPEVTLVTMTMNLMYGILG